MLFAAGMGIGLIFYGVAEPITQYTASVEGDGAPRLGGMPGKPEAAARLAMAATIFHAGVLLIPSLVSVVWMTAFGGTAITQLIDVRTAVSSSAGEW